MTGSPFFFSSVIVPAATYDPTTWITGTPDYADDFESLAADASVNGRTLPTGGGTWVADATWTGAGSGAIKTTTDGGAVKGTSPAYADCKCRMLWDQGGSLGTSYVTLFIKDEEAASYPRNGYLFRITTNTQTAQLVKSETYSETTLTSANSVTIATGLNVAEIRHVGSSLTGYFNGTAVCTATDSTYGYGKVRFGFTIYPDNTLIRVTYVDFTVL